MWGGGGERAGNNTTAATSRLYFGERESLLDLNRSRLLNKLGNARLA
jgi:hypothetical protein